MYHYWLHEEDRKRSLIYHYPDLLIGPASLLNLNGSNNPYFEQISMVQRCSSHLSLYCILIFSLVAPRVCKLGLYDPVYIRRPQHDKKYHRACMSQRRLRATYVLLTSGPKTLVHVWRYSDMFENKRTYLELIISVIHLVTSITDLVWTLEYFGEQLKDKTWIKACKRNIFYFILNLFMSSGFACFNIFDMSISNRRGNR